MVPMKGRGRKGDTRLIHLNSDNQVVVVLYQGGDRYLTRHDIGRLLDIETRLCLKGAGNSLPEPPRPSPLSPSAAQGKRSLASIGKLVAPIFVAGEADVDVASLEKLIAAIEDFDGIVKKRATAEAAPRLEAMLNWKIDQKYKLVISDFLRKYAELDAKNRKRKRRNPQ